MNNKYKKVFAKVLIAFEDLSTCARLKVAALIIRDTRIISTGYNGVPTGDIHCNDNSMFGDINTWNKKITEKHHRFAEVGEIHAEENSLAFAAKNGMSTDNTIMFTSIAPCRNCAKLILVAGIKEIYYLEEYDRDEDGINFLKEHGIMIERLIYVE